MIDTVPLPTLFPSRVSVFEHAEALWRTGQHLVISGMLGSGRTVFAHRLLWQHEGRVHRIQGAHPLKDVAFSALASLTAYVPDSNGGSAPDVAQLIAALAHRTPDTPARSLFIENAEWIDEASAAAFAQVAASGNLQLIVTWTAGSQLPLAFQHLMAGPARIELGPITSADTALMLEETFHTSFTTNSVDRLARMGAGNPALIAELASDAVTTGAVTRGEHLIAIDPMWKPRGRRIAELVSLRLRELPVDAREAVEMLAVTGPLPEHVASGFITASALDTAIDAGLIVSSATSSFPTGNHTENVIELGGSLTPETVVTQLSRERLRQLASRARDHLPRELLSPRTRIALSLHAVMLGIPCPPEWITGDVVEAFHARDFATVVALTSHTTPGLTAHTRVLRARSLFEIGQTDEAIALASSELELETKSPGGASTEHVPHARLALAEMEIARWDNLDRATELLEDAAYASHPEVRAVREILLARSHGPVNVIELLSVAEDPSVTAERRLTAQAFALMGTSYIGTALLALTRSFEAMGSSLWQAAGPSAQGDLIHAVSVAINVRGVSPEHLSQHPLAVDWDALTLGDFAYLGAVAVERLECGDALGASELLSHAMFTVKDVDPHGVARHLCALASVAASLAGDPAEGARLRAVAEGARYGSAGVLRPESDRLLVLSAHGAGDPKAASLMHDYIERMRSQGFNAMVMRALHDGWRYGAVDDLSHLTRVAATVEGELGSALRLYEAALAGDDEAFDRATQLHLDTGRVLYAAELAASAARASMQRGERSRAGMQLNRAWELVTKLGPTNTPALRRARVDASVLSEREYEICLRAAAGLSNTEISDELFLSTRTVEGHLQRAYRKLGITDRRSLAPEAVRVTTR